MVILFDRYNLPDDVYEIIFATDQQRIVGKALISYMRENGVEITKTEMSNFATLLHDGNYECNLEEPQFKGKKVKLAYNKRQFYDRILTPMKGMGLIDYNLYKKTYKISDQFSKEMTRIGLMWARESRKTS